MSQPQFYLKLPVHQIPLSHLLEQASYFEGVPSDWHVIVTDIKNSTRAIGDGMHETVNLVATGSIIATLNIAYQAQIGVPFFFGGDGATMLVPQELLQQVLQALQVHRANTIDTFGLDLRVGAVGMDALLDNNHEVFISRLQISDALSIPVVLGTGLAEAERRIKGLDDDTNPDKPPRDALNLDGMECRWDKIKPGGSAEEVVSLIVSANDGKHPAPAFKRVVDCIDAIYGPYASRNPVSSSQLHLDWSLQKVSLETRTRFGRMDWLYLIRNWFMTQISRFLFLSQGSGQHYLESIVALTDTLVIDGRISTVIAGTPQQRIQLEKALDTIEMEGAITYGLHVSGESVMSCYVRDRQDQHIHFVDGSEGGYTRAASIWKRKKQSHGTI